MKSQLLAVGLFTATAATVAFYPALPSIGAIATPAANHVPAHTPPVKPLANERPQIEVVFVLDTTGSMSGLIQAAKEKIWSIATTMASAQNAPDIKIGLVAYRDRGDTYVTRVVDLSSDLDTLYATLMDFQAGGGGDGPESVNQALHEAVNRISWSNNPHSYKAVFLVGDAPPHMDYQDDVKYPVTISAARARGIVVNTIQCGQESDTTPQWQQMAALGQGQYFQVAQAGNAVAIATPFDEKLAALSAKLDDTRLYYGSKEEKVKQARKVAATDKLHAAASPATLARRATFNASKSGEANLLGEGDLVGDVKSGRVDLKSIAPEKLPAAVRALAPEEQQALIAATAEKRNELQMQIKALSEERSSFLKKKVAETGGAKESLDDKIYEAVKDQATAAGLHYEAETPAY